MNLKAVLIPATAVIVGSVLSLGPGTRHGPTQYESCRALHHTYPHGVGARGAADAVDGTAPVTDFAVNTRVYDANAGLDTDGDGIACEQ